MVILFDVMELRCSALLLADTGRPIYYSICPKAVAPDIGKPIPLPSLSIYLLFHFLTGQNRMIHLLLTLLSNMATCAQVQPSLMPES
jgi:hypothetical protein